jgi:hypothetical protein
MTMAMAMAILMVLNLLWEDADNGQLAPQRPLV